MNIDYTFSYRKFLVSALAKVADDAGVDASVIEAVCEKLEDAETGKVFLRRKPETISILLPDWLAELSPDAQAITQPALTEISALFVRKNYLENYMEVPADITWEDIQRWYLSKGSRSAGIEIDSDTLKAAAKHFGGFVGRSIKNKEAGEKLASIMRGKFTESTIKRVSGDFSEQLLTTLAGWLDRWADNVATDPQLSAVADDYADVYAYCEQRIQKHQRTEQRALTDILALD